MKGYRHSKETKQKISIMRLKQVFPRRDTKIEVKLQKELKNNSIPYETHKAIFGQPDIFIKPNLCIFADGDYWHNLERCKKRDIEVNNVLINKGYIILRFWEHEIKNQIDSCLNIIKQFYKPNYMNKTNGGLI